MRSNKTDEHPSNVRHFRAGRVGSHHAMPAALKTSLRAIQASTTQHIERARICKTQSNTEEAALINGSEAEI